MTQIISYGNGGIERISKGRRNKRCNTK